MDKISPLIAAFLLYIKENEKPADAIELAVIDTAPSFILDNKDRLSIKMESAKLVVFCFLHPEVSERIKRASHLLKFSMLNFDALENGELEKICDFLTEAEKYFNG